VFDFRYFSIFHLKWCKTNTLRKRVLIVHDIQRWGINTLTKCIIMYVSDTRCILASVFAFSAFLGCILPLCRLRYIYITVAVICGKTAVTWFAASTNQRRSAFSILHFTFRIPHSAIPHFTHTRSHQCDQGT